MGCVEEKIVGAPDKKLIVMYYGGVWIPVIPEGFSLWIHQVYQVKRQLYLVELEDNPRAFPALGRGWGLSWMICEAKKPQPLRPQPSCYELGTPVLIWSHEGCEE